MRMNRNCQLACTGIVSTICFATSAIVVAGADDDASLRQNQERPPKEASTEPLPPEQAIKQFKVSPDLAVDLIAAEPVVQQPVFLNFDERGRMWVVQYRQYPTPAGLKRVSRDKHYRSVYDKVPLPPGHPDHVPGADKITIHEDSDGDGTFDEVKTFVEGLNVVTSVAQGRGGVWVLNPPYLLFYPDRDQDDVPDGPPVVHLEGFGLEDSHEVVNSLRWGPDGWLYAAQGATVSAQVKRPGVTTEPIHSIGQLVWRYHPEKKTYEIFAEGGGNNWSCVFDSAGRLFGGTNGTARGFHYVQGGYYSKNFFKHGELSNPHIYGNFEGLELGGIRLHTSLAIYEGGAMPTRLNGVILGCNSLAGLIDITRLVPAGSTFTPEDGGSFVESADRWFRPVDIKVGPDGAVYIVDWYDQQINHIRNNEGRIDKGSGRVYRVRRRDADPIKPFNLATRSNDELIDLLGHRNRWFRDSALRLLADRREESALPRLRRMLETQTGQPALEALWALNASGGFIDDARISALQHTYPRVRSWAIRLIGDERDATPREAAIMADYARFDPDIELRSQLASSARRLPIQIAMPIIEGLLSRDEDADDAFLPLLIWWAIESKCQQHPDAVVALFQNEEIWRGRVTREFVLQRVMRRFASTEKRADLVVCAQLLNLSPTEQATARLMQGFEEAYRGRSMVGLPEEFNRQLDRIGGGSLVTRVRRGDSQAIAQALKAVTNRHMQAQQRMRLIEAFGEVTNASAVSALISNLDDSDASIVRASLVALQSYEDDRIAVEVLVHWSKLPESIQAVAGSLLSSRGSWALQWVEAVQSGGIDKTLVPRDALVDMQRHKNANLDKLIIQIWGQQAPTSKEVLEAEIGRLTEVIRGKSGGNPYDGHDIFLERCANCHTLYNEGGKVGPDLTGYRHQSLDSLLLSIVNPSAEIREGFERHTVLTADGRILSGLVVDQNESIVVIRPPAGQDLVLKRQEIDEFVPDRTSLMPTGSLENMTDGQLRDLFAYLRTSQPLTARPNK